MKMFSVPAEELGLLEERQLIKAMLWGPEKGEWGKSYYGHGNV